LGTNSLVFKLVQQLLKAVPIELSLLTEAIDCYPEIECKGTQETGDE